MGAPTWYQDVPKSQEREGPVTEGQWGEVEPGDLEHHGELWKRKRHRFYWESSSTSTCATGPPPPGLKGAKGSAVTTKSCKPDRAGSPLSSPSPWVGRYQTLSCSPTCAEKGSGPLCSVTQPVGSSASLSAPSAQQQLPCPKGKTEEARLTQRWVSPQKGCLQLAPLCAWLQSRLGRTHNARGSVFGARQGAPEGLANPAKSQPSQGQLCCPHPTLLSFLVPTVTWAFLGNSRQPPLPGPFSPPCF